jgi:hypothetical protein
LENNLPRTFTIDPNALAANKLRIASGAHSLDAPLARLLREADDALKAGPFSVMHKSIVPPSGDKHDYISRGRYWWRNPNTPDGLPYIEHDGEVNPEIWQIPDHKEFDTLMDNVLTLGLAFYFTERMHYADYAVKLLREWFLDEQTRMNPHLAFGQGIPGINEGRCTGLIETRELVQVVDAIGLLANCTAWTETDQWGMERWFTRYLDWLVWNEMAQLEGAQKNNHGTFYDTQVISIALFLNARELAQKYLRRFSAERIPTQIASDGRQPFEIVRTLAWHYSVFNLQALYRFASLGERVEIDLWNFATPDGRSLRLATDFLVPYVEGKTWEYPQIAPQDFNIFFDVLCQASVKYRDARYYQVACKSPQVDTASHRVRLRLNLA